MSDPLLDMSDPSYNNGHMISLLVVFLSAKTHIAFPMEFIAGFSFLHFLGKRCNCGCYGLANNGIYYMSTQPALLSCNLID